MKKIEDYTTFTGKVKDFVWKMFNIKHVIDMSIFANTEQHDFFPR